MIRGALNNMLMVAHPSISATDWNFLQTLRKEYDPKGYAFIEPHFTLFASHSDHYKCNMRNVISKQLSCQKKIAFNLRTALFMPPLNQHKSWYTFLLPEEGFNELSRLHRLLCDISILSDLAANFPFIPHITVGTFQVKNPCLELVDKINNMKINISGFIEKIYLLELDNVKPKLMDEFLLE